jgi:sulfite reductase beta subunit-like hemoprotein
MVIDWQRLRLDGVYKMKEEGELMLRVKVPAGVLAAEQAIKVAELAERFANGTVHLTSRASIELHRLQLADLSEVLRQLAAVGLTGRGACGGAVRGVSCSTTFGEGFAVAQVLARKLHWHFAGNPHFEALPKKFKIGVDAGYSGSRHLIQDAGLVHVGSGESELYDLWLAGGLGREPQAAFRYAERLPEGKILPLLEAVLRLYGRYAPAGKRLKHVVRELGEDTFRRLLAAEYAAGPAQLQLADVVAKQLTVAAPACTLQAAVFAGELPAKALRTFATVAARFAAGYLALTADQNVAFLLADGDDAEDAREMLAAAGYPGDKAEERVNFRICPGSHECRLGLSPTRDIARQLIAGMHEAGKKLTWAISGCLNSCSQPQLADCGIVTVKTTPGPDGTRRPLFDLYRRQGEGLGMPVRQGLTLDELLEAVKKIRPA